MCVQKVLLTFLQLLTGAPIIGHIPGLPTEATKVAHIASMSEVTRVLRRGPDLKVKSIEKTLISNAFSVQ